MNRPINSGKRVDGVDRFLVELSRFVRLDRFQGLVLTPAKSDPVLRRLDTVPPPQSVTDRVTVVLSLVGTSCRMITAHTTVSVV